MSGKAIGKNLPFGYRGNVTRTPDTIIGTFVNCGSSNINYGEPVVFDATSKGVRKVLSTDTVGTNIIGIAVRRVGQPYIDSDSGWYYKSGDTVDVLLRGSIAVELKSASGIAGKGSVYVANGSYASRAAGDIVCANDTTNDDTLCIPNAVFATGNYDSNNIAEVTILARSM